MLGGERARVPGRLPVALAAALAIVVAALIVVGQVRASSPGDAAPTERAAGQFTTEPAGPGPTAARDDAERPETEPDSTPRSGQRPPSHSPGPSDGASADPTHPSELPKVPETEADERPPLPVLPALIVPDDAPSSESAVGAIVDSFPTAVVALPDGITVLSSDVSTEGRKMRLTLDALGGNVEAVIDFYLTSLSQLGFAAAPAIANPGTTAVAFTRHDGSLLLSASPEATGSRFSVAGTLELAH